MLLDASSFHMGAHELSRQLFKEVKITTTPMTGLDPQASYVRLDFSNEPQKRLIGLGKKVKRILET